MSESQKEKMSIWAMPLIAAILIGQGGWIMAKVAANSEQITANFVALNAGKEARLKTEVENKEAHGMIADKLEQLISRREFETTTTAIKAEIITAQARIMECSVAIKALELRVGALEIQIRAMDVGKK